MCQLEPCERPSFRSVEFMAFCRPELSPEVPLAEQLSAEQAGNLRELSVLELAKVRRELDAQGFARIDEVAPSGSTKELFQHSVARLKLMVEGRPGSVQKPVSQHGYATAKQLSARPVLTRIM